MSKEDTVDAHLLRVFCALMAEGSVTRAAVKLEQSQPAVSLALGKLREIFSDQLLVRGRDGMVPTERALAILPRAQALLADLTGLVDATAPFDASSSNHSFTIASPDYMAPVFLSEIVDQIRRKAPSASLVIRALGPDFDFEGALARGDVDVVIGNWPSPPAYLKRSILLQDDIVCLMRESHPLAQGTFSEADYLAAAHIVPVAYSMAHRGVVETHLSSLRVSRARTVALSYFTTAPYLLLQSDLIFSTSHHFASYFAGLLPLVVRQPPIEFPQMVFHMLWHDRSHHSPMHRWLREIIMQARNRIAT
ncbi:LysR family transcriptional regulator [Ensifer sp. B1-9]|uniref:LysR family transcriptional regulator n=1 Tax=Ensifer sp. B1-9 TaxID=3141455 RepID=UPI003D25DCEA